MLSILQKARLLHCYRFCALRISPTLSSDLVERSVVKDFHTFQSLYSDWFEGDGTDEDYFKGGNSNHSSRVNLDAKSRNNRNSGWDDSKYISGDKYRNDSDNRGGGGGYRNNSYKSSGSGYKSDNYRKNSSGYRNDSYNKRSGGYGRGDGYRSGFGRQGDESLANKGFFYPENIDTHNLSGIQRRKLVWSDPTPANPVLERDLFKDCRDHDDEVEMSVDITVKSTTGSLHEPCKTFEEMGLGSIIKNNIRLMKLKKPTPIQKYAIPIIMEGHNILGSAQTGSGKTGAFLIPVIDKMCKEGPPPQLLHDTTADVLPVTLILSPTRELAIQTFNEAQKLTYRSHVRPYVCYGGSNINRNITELQKGTELLVATPGRLQDLLERGVVSMRCIQTLILDEADYMFDTGFSNAVHEICLESDMPKQKQTLLFSATFPLDIMLLSKRMMTSGESVKVSIGRVGSTCDTITQKFISVTSYFQKKPILMELIETFEKESKTLVFVSTKAMSRELAEDLEENGYNAAPINGDLNQMARERALNKFKSGKTNILVATEVAARGLDIPSIDQVVNFDMPNTVDQYVHRIGRTGRVGRKGTAVTMVNPLKDQHLISGIKQLLIETKQKSPDFMSKTHSTKKRVYEKKEPENLPSFE